MKNKNSSSTFKFFLQWLWDHAKRPVDLALGTLFFALFCFGAGQVADMIFKPKHLAEAPIEVTSDDSAHSTSAAKRGLASIGTEKNQFNTKRRSQNRHSGGSLGSEPISDSPPVTTGANQGSPQVIVNGTPYVGNVVSARSLSSDGRGNSGPSRSGSSSNDLSDGGILAGQSAASTPVPGLGQTNEQNYSPTPRGNSSLPVTAGFQVVSGAGTYILPTLRVRVTVGDPVSPSYQTVSGGPTLISGIEGVYYGH